ncbi:MAG: chemotaxis protein CheW, partial [Candidatus Hodarchaeales archaeon]
MSVSSSELTQAGKFIIFGIADDLFGLEVDNLKEVFQTNNILQLPRTSELLAGIVNLRGVIISVFDLSMLLWGNASQSLSDKTSVDVSEITMNILLTTIKEQDVGILVDHIYHLGEITSFK